MHAPKHALKQTCRPALPLFLRRLMPALVLLALLTLSIGCASKEATGPTADKKAEDTQSAIASGKKPAGPAFQRKDRGESVKKPMAGGRPPFKPEFTPEEAAKRESKFLANIRQVTTEGKNGEGYFSPDGKRIIWQSVRGKHPFYQIVTKTLPDGPDMTKGKEQIISTGKGRTTCAYFHPKEDKILYASSHLDPEHQEAVVKELQRMAEALRSGKRANYTWFFDPHMDIFEAKPDGSELKRLTKTPGYDAEGSYSSDGKQIVYTSFQNGNGDIYVMNADGSKPRQITNSPGYDGGPFFSPDNKRIIFRGEARKREYLQLFVINADGSGERQLTDDGNLNWAPYWHPSGKYVIYTTSRHGHFNYELYILNLQTLKKTRVTFAMGGDVLPVFSPDGKKLMWTSTRDQPRGKDGRRVSQLFIADWVYDGE